MRIPFPERVNLSYALIFASVLLAVQLFEGTNAFFAGCIFCFILVAAFSFNIAGGIPYPSGTYIGFNAILTVILPMTVKAILGEPADSNLRAPTRIAEVYLLGMVAMLAAAIFSRRFRPRRAFISDMMPVDSMRSAYIGCAALSVIITLYLSFFNYGGQGTFDSFLVQANRFPILTFILGVLYTFHRTQGRRSMSGPLLLMVLYFAAGSLVNFSKEGFISPFFAWGITVALLGYRLHWINIASFAFGVFFLVTFLVPYAQFGRSYQAAISPYALSAYMLTHMDEVRESYESNAELLGNVHYYNKSLSLLNRLDFISLDSALVDVADRQGPYGLRPLKEGWTNIIPHVFYPNKPVPYYGNTYGHEIGILPYDDFTTGVSFSPSADAYREGLFNGVLVYETVTLLIIFIILDSVIGDVRMNPVGVLATILISRAAAEGALWGSPTLVGQALFTNVLAAYVCAYALPMLGSIFNKQFLHTGPSNFALGTSDPSLVSPVSTT